MDSSTMRIVQISKVALVQLVALLGFDQHDYTDTDYHVWIHIKRYQYRYVKLISIPIIGIVIGYINIANYQSNPRPH